MYNEKMIFKGVKLTSIEELIRVKDKALYTLYTEILFSQAIKGLQPFTITHNKKDTIVSFINS